MNLTEMEGLVASRILRRAHRVHTIILYGSYARGDATAESDVDVAAFADDREDGARRAALARGRSGRLRLPFGARRRVTTSTC